MKNLIDFDEDPIPPPTKPVKKDLIPTKRVIPVSKPKKIDELMKENLTDLT